MFIKYHTKVCSKGLLRQEWVDKTFKDIDCLCYYNNTLVRQL